MKYFLRNDNHAPYACEGNHLQSCFVQMAGLRLHLSAMARTSYRVLKIDPTLSRTVRWEIFSWLVSLTLESISETEEIQLKES